MTRREISFALITLAALIVAYTIHKSFDAPIIAGESRLLSNYLFNLVLTIALMGLIFFLSRKKSEQIGFAYLGGISLKFIFFLFVLYPSVVDDGSASRTEFARFFVPFGICVLLEVVMIYRILKDD